VSGNWRIVKHSACFHCKAEHSDDIGCNSESVHDSLARELQVLKTPDAWLLNETDRGESILMPFKISCGMWCA